MQGQLLEVIGCIYVLINPVRKWHVSVLQRMKKMGWETHSFDVAVLILKGAKGTLIPLPVLRRSASIVLALQRE
eukprot:6760271-Prorocentrum_lima.AAC.1